MTADGAVLAALDLTGAPLRATDPAALGAPGVVGLVGVDVAATSVDGAATTVVQVLFDDDVAGFDRTLLDAPLVAELTDASGATVARELCDHDAFRRRLLAERDAGEHTTRGVLLLTGGQPPPPWVRLAFLPVPLGATRFARLVLRRADVAELRAGIDAAVAAGEATDDERRALLTVLEQLHGD